MRVQRLTPRGGPSRRHERRQQATRNPYHPKETYQETARLIPDCTLRRYEGKGHEVDERSAEDVLDFVRQHPAAAPGHATPPLGAR